jgi:hypothetical protein
LRFPAQFLGVRSLNRLRRSASSDLNNGRNEKCKQGYHEYDLCGGERGSGHDAKAERARDQSNDKKGDRPAKHDGLLTLFWLLSQQNLKGSFVFQ